MEVKLYEGSEGGLQKGGAFDLCLVTQCAVLIKH